MPTTAPSAPPAADTACTAEPGPTTPAPTSTILAVLARIASHAGEPLSIMTMTPHRIVVTVDHLDVYAGWCREVDVAPGAEVRVDSLGSLTEVHGCLHGWHLTLQLTA